MSPRRYSGPVRWTPHLANLARTACHLPPTSREFRWRRSARVTFRSPWARPRRRPERWCSAETFAETSDEGRCGGGGATGAAGALGASEGFRPPSHGLTGNAVMRVIGPRRPAVTGPTAPGIARVSLGAPGAGPRGRAVMIGGTFRPPPGRAPLGRRPHRRPPRPARPRSRRRRAARDECAGADLRLRRRTGPGRPPDRPCHRPRTARCRSGLAYGPVARAADEHGRLTGHVVHR